MQSRYLWACAASVILVLGAGSLAGASSREISAQTPAALDDQTLLSLVLPPLADGSRPGVHMWARADQGSGPGGLPTVFVVTLYSRQTGSGTEEREVVNYVQYSGNAWSPARPRDVGTLLVSDWAWLSLNLTNLTAIVIGTGSSSQYTVDYTSSGVYAGNPRELSLEETYAADLALTSSTVLSDSATGASVTTPGTPPAAGATGSARSTLAAPSPTPGTTATATSTSAAPATATRSVVSVTPAISGTVTGTPHP
jgi:hypothetical protein